MQYILKGQWVRVRYPRVHLSYSHANLWHFVWIYISTATFESNGSHVWSGSPVALRAAPVSPEYHLWAPPFDGPGGCFTNFSWALQNNLAKIHNAKNHICVENFKLKLCTCAQSMALGTRTKCQLEILIRSTISAIHNFRENILESSRNVSETTPWS